MKNFVEELKWRGMVQDIMPGTEEKLMEGPTAAYVGIDPTADSLHIGHMVSIMILKHFQNCGHKPFALVGGATGMIGDPSMKSQERNLLDEQTLNHNVACIKAQLSKFLDFESDADNRAELVNNYDWMKGYSFLDFTRDIGKHITVNYMMSKDSVKKRLSSESREGMSFTEFTYQLLQGYDFLWLYENKGCTLQMGGADQWGNITTGSELIRRILGKEAYALTCPLITKADGGKFGKTEKGKDFPIPVLPVLAQCIRHRRREVHQDIHHARQRGNRLRDSHSPAGAAREKPPETPRKRGYHHGAWRTGIRKGRVRFPDAFRQCHFRGAQEP